jgi:hypothetical protein
MDPRNSDLHARRAQQGPADTGAPDRGKVERLIKATQDNRYSQKRSTGDYAVMFSSRRSQDSERKSVEQRVPITWTACHLGGRRAWFRCAVYSNGRYCGRRVALLYGAGELFACRRCYGLAYASQQEAPMHRGVYRAQKIRMRLGGSANLCEPFPEKPKRMHWRTYLHLRARGFA